MLICWRQRAVRFGFPQRPFRLREGRQLSDEPATFNDGQQPVADLGRAANGIHDLAGNAIPPNQVAAGRLCVQGAIIGCDRDDLGRLDAKTLFDKLGGSDLDERRRDRKSVLGVIRNPVL